MFAGSDVYGIKVGKLLVYWTKPFAVWWGDRELFRW